MDEKLSGLDWESLNFVYKIEGFFFFLAAWMGGGQAHGGRLGDLLRTHPH